jgi:poly(hydroxyalkanoate) granule-associated protein
MAANSKTGDTGSRAENAADSTAEALRESAEKIWLAGLGAFERMKSDGPRMFETLVEQGRNMSVKAKDAADQALRAMRESNFEGGGRWDKFQQDMQERVSKSLGTFGVTTTKQVEELARQVAELNDHVRNLMAAPARGGASRKASRSSAGGRKKATAKKAASKRGGTRKARAR